MRTIWKEIKWARCMGMYKGCACNKLSLWRTALYVLSILGGRA
jgi:hypothetical protein